MAEIQKDEYKFPDEIDDGLDVDLDPKAKEATPEPEEKASKFDIEIEDDTPAEDRNKEPMPKEIVEELEKDELDKYYLMLGQTEGIISDDEFSEDLEGELSSSEPGPIVRHGE